MIILRTVKHISSLNIVASILLFLKVMKHIRLKKQMKKIHASLVVKSLT